MKASNPLLSDLQLKAIHTVEAMNRKLQKRDDTCIHLMVTVCTGPGSDNRFFIKMGYATIMDSIDHNWIPREESLERYLWDELADWADSWQKIIPVIRKYQTK